MKYADETTALLGDIVIVQTEKGNYEGRIVMLGENHTHLALDADFIEWVIADNVLDSDSVAIQWTGENPYAHNDPRYAPVGDILFTTLGETVSKKTNNA
jgi:hypothetical protein